MNAIAQPSSALSSTGISISMPLTRSGAAAAASSVAFAPSDVPPITACFTPAASSSAIAWRPKMRHAVVPHLGRAVGLAVAEQVEAQHPVAALGERLGERPVHLAREQQAGQQDHDAVAASVLVVDQPVSLELEILGRALRPTIAAH